MTLNEHDTIPPHHFLLLVGKQSFHGGDFVFHGLRLVRARADSYVRLDADDASSVQHRVALAHDFHDLVPGSFCSGSRIVSDGFQRLTFLGLMELDGRIYADGRTSVGHHS